MRIGIIGSGHIGGTLTRRLRALGHDVVVTNSRGPQSLTDLAAETGAMAGTLEEAAQGVELLIIAVPVTATRTAYGRGWPRRGPEGVPESSAPPATGPAGHRRA